MSKKKFENIPQLLLDMATVLNDKNYNIKIRYNYQSTMMDIIDYCNEQLEKFQKEQSKRNKDFSLKEKSKYSRVGL